MTLPTFYTVKEIADTFRLDQSTIRRWIREGKLKCSGLTKRNRTVTEHELERFLKAHQIDMQGRAANIVHHKKQVA